MKQHAFLKKSEWRRDELYIYNVTDYNKKLTGH